VGATWNTTVSFTTLREFMELFVILPVGFDIVLFSDSLTCFTSINYGRLDEFKTKAEREEGLGATALEALAKSNDPDSGGGR